MATNFEFYKDEILKIVKKRTGFGVVNGEVKSCDEIGCTEQCIFHEGKYFCLLDSRIEWLYAEHIEQPKLTKRERAFCEVVRVGWIARDESGNLHLFDLVSKPYKQNGEWLKRSVSCNHIRVNSDEFDFIKWEDEKPWAVEELLKLEVEE